MYTLSKNKSILPLIAFFSLGIIWGSNFIYMKLASDLISPMQIVLFRVLFGFIPVFVFSWLSGSLSLGHLRHAPHFFIMSLLATSVYYYSFAKGTSLLLSGIAGALSGSIPLFSFILATLLIPEERATKTKLLGILTGLIGVLAIARPSGEDLSASNLEGVLYMILGSLSVGASFVYARKYIMPLKIPAAGLTAYQLGAALIILSLVTDYDGMKNIWTDLHASVGLVIGLGLFGTGGAYIFYYYIVEQLGAITAASVTYIPPLVALLIGALLVKEPISMMDYFGTAMIFAGVLLLKKRDSR